MRQTVYAIEAKNQAGTVALFDISNGMRTQWVGLDYGLNKTEEVVKDFIEDQQAEWVSGEDLFDEDGRALYGIID